MADEAQIKIGADTKGAEDGVDRVKGKLGDLKSPVDRAAESFSELKEVAGAALAGLGVEKIAAFVESTAEAAERLSNMAGAVGMSVEQFSDFSNTLTVFGGDAEGARRTIELLEQNMGAAIADPTSRAAKLFETLGISIGEIKKGQEDVPGFLDLLRQKWQGFADDAGKAAVFRELLGRGFDELVPYLKATDEGLGKVNQRLKDMNAQLDAGTAEKLEKVSQSFKFLGVAWGDASRSLVADAAPAIERINNSLADMFTWVIKVANGTYSFKDALDAAAAANAKAFPAVAAPFSGRSEASTRPQWGGPIGASMDAADAQRRLAQAYQGQGYTWAEPPKPSITPPSDKETAGGGTGDDSDATMGQLHQVLDQMEVDTQTSYQKQRQFALEFWQGVAAQAEDGSKLQAAAQDEANRLILESDRETAEKKQELLHQQTQEATEEAEKEEQARVEANKRALAIIQADQEKAKQQQEQAIEEISHVFDEEVTGILRGTETIGQVTARTFGNMAVDFIESVAKMMAQWALFGNIVQNGPLSRLLSNIMPKAGGGLMSLMPASIQGLFGGAGGAAGAASETTAATTQMTAATTQQTAAATMETAAGTMMSAASAMSAGSTAGGGGGMFGGLFGGLFGGGGGDSVATFAPSLAGFDVGAWSVPGDMAARIHQGEMIIPADQAQSMREGAVFSAAGAGEMAGGPKSLTINAVDRRSVERLIRDQGSTVARSMRTAWRNGSPSLR